VVSGSDHAALAAMCWLPLYFCAASLRLVVYLRMFNAIMSSTGATRLKPATMLAPVWLTRTNSI
jgi:hypothetical protein